MNFKKSYILGFSKDKDEILFELTGFQVASKDTQGSWSGSWGPPQNLNKWWSNFCQFRFFLIFKSWRAKDLSGTHSRTRVGFICL